MGCIRIKHEVLLNAAIHVSQCMAGDRSSCIPLPSSCCSSSCHIQRVDHDGFTKRSLEIHDLRLVSGVFLALPGYRGAAIAATFHQQLHHITTINDHAFIMAAYRQDITTARDRAFITGEYLLYHIEIVGGEDGRNSKTLTGEHMKNPRRIGVRVV
jgi:hypothetical protein